MVCEVDAELVGGEDDDEGVGEDDGADREERGGEGEGAMREGARRRDRSDGGDSG